MRRWNGEQWIGFAIPDPSKPATIHGTSRTTHTRLRLSQSGAILSVGAITALSSLAVVFVLTTTRILRNVDLLRSATNDAPDGSSAGSEVIVPVTVLQLSSVLMILEAVSLLCIATTVGQITARLTR